MLVLSNMSSMPCTPVASTCKIMNSLWSTHLNRGFHCRVDTNFYFFGINIFTRIEVAFQPALSKQDSINGVSWRSFAAAAFPLTSKHHVSSSIGPALTAGRKFSGIKTSMVFSLALDSLMSPAILPSETEFSTAWWAVTACFIKIGLTVWKYLFTGNNF